MMNKTWLSVHFVIMLALCIVSTSHTKENNVELVNITSSGEMPRPGFGTYADSQNPAITADGRYVVFESFAVNMVPDDTNFKLDIFVRDLVAGTTKRVSVNTWGVEGNGNSRHPAISTDGRFIVFESEASNLVVDDTNFKSDIFVRDLIAGTTKRVSVSNDGRQADGSSGSPAISSDGRYVFFDSGADNLVTGDANQQTNIFVRDLVAGTTKRISVASENGQEDGPSWGPSISGDGRYVAFSSSASNLVAGDTNQRTDVFVHDLAGGITKRVSITSGGGQGDNNSWTPVISGNGRYVAFSSEATNLVVDDTNGTDIWMFDVFLHDIVEGITKRISISEQGVQGNGSSQQFPVWPQSVK